MISKTSQALTMIMVAQVVTFYYLYVSITLLRTLQTEKYIFNNKGELDSCYTTYLRGRE